MIELCVIKSIQEVNRAGPRRSKANSDLASELRMPAGHECGHFLMPHLDEFKLVLSSANCAHDPIDAIARKPKHPFDAPFQQPVDEKIGDVLFHVNSVRLLER